MSSLPEDTPDELIRGLFKIAAVDPQAHPDNQFDSGGAIDCLVDCGGTPNWDWLKMAFEAGVCPWAWDDSDGDPGIETISLMVAQGGRKPETVLKVLALMVECDCFETKGPEHQKFNEDRLDSLIKSAESVKDPDDATRKVITFASFIRWPTQQELKGVMALCRDDIMAKRKNPFSTLVMKWKENKLVYKMPKWAKPEL